MKKIALFASGSGSNVENIYNYFKEKTDVQITKVYCNNRNAGVLERCNRLGIPFMLFSKTDFLKSNKVENDIEDNNIDLIVLAGFLLLIPEKFIERFKERVINIHPALLPKHGGQGMYGDNVHKSVVQHKDTESGITIHLVNEIYDDGEIIFQAKCEVNPLDTYSDVAEKVHVLEYEHYPRIIEEYLRKLP